MLMCLIHRNDDFYYANTPQLTIHACFLLILLVFSLVLMQIIYLNASGTYWGKIRYFIFMQVFPHQ